MRVTLCDTCSKNVRPDADPNFFGHTMSIEIPPLYRHFRDINQRVYDFCSPECREEWFENNGKTEEDDEE